MKFKNIFYRKPSLRIALRYSIIASIIILTFSLLVPKLLNYGPESINTDFDIQMSYIPFWMQFLCIGLLLVFLIIITTHFLFRSVDKFYLSRDPNKYNDLNLIKKVRKKCFSLPYLIPISEVIISALSALLVLILTGSHLSVMVAKILIIVFSFSLILAVSSFIFSKGIYNEILTKTYKEDINIGLRINLKSKILLQILPLFVFCISLLAFIGYSFTVHEKEDLYFDVYSKLLNENFSSEKTYKYDDLYKKFDNLDLFESTHSKFIIMNDNSVLTLQGEAPSYFVQEYTKQIANKYDGRIYDSYGVESQGKSMKIKTDKGDCNICILYNVTSSESLIYLVLCGISLFIISGGIVYIFSDSLAKDISEVADNFERLSSNEFGKTLPVTTNDEIGDLINSFNLVQKYSQSQVNQIKNNQEILMERERLATLGQMVGGIAHNLKTPIMSISGASEGLKDLINEYDKSIEDSEVTASDHHEIAGDMRKWIDKINNYTEYMSDIITAVKGQAVTLSNQEIVSFTVGELVKRVDILMKHELKHSLVDLNIHMNVDENLTLHGDINSLVQVLNNLISNSIQAYAGIENGSIDLDLNKSGDSLVITVTDYGKGIPVEVQERLFKEMVTTKGKNGTGLGLFMSYSNIRAHFNGNMTFESEVGKGTKFEIVLPV